MLLGVVLALVHCFVPITHIAGILLLYDDPQFLCSLTTTSCIMISASGFRVYPPSHSDVEVTMPGRAVRRQGQGRSGVRERVVWRTRRRLAEWMVERRRDRTEGECVRSERAVSSSTDPTPSLGVETLKEPCNKPCIYHIPHPGS